MFFFVQVKYLEVRVTGSPGTRRRSGAIVASKLRRTWCQISIFSAKSTTAVISISDTAPDEAECCVGGVGWRTSETS